MKNTLENQPLPTLKEIMTHVEEAIRAPTTTVEKLAKSLIAVKVARLIDRGPGAIEMAFAEMHERDGGTPQLRMPARSRGKGKGKAEPKPPPKKKVKFGPLKLLKGGT